MESKKRLPQTLLEAIRYFSDIDIATEFVAKLRWPDGPVCPRCDGKQHSYLKTRRIWKCKQCKRQFSVKKGTIFEDSPLGLDKWVAAIWLIANCKNGISSHELARDLGIHQQSAWFMLHRIRLAMQTGSFEKASGEVEIDETFVGGKARNMHASKRKAHRGGTGHMGSRHLQVVFGALERGGEVRVMHVPDRRKDTVAWEIRENVAHGSQVYSDDALPYSGLGHDYDHQVVNHAEKYVDGQIHTNGLENFWSLLKRGLHGTYISVEPFHLFRYLDEQVYRYNARKDTDLGRVMDLLGRVEGRRLTYEQVTGKT